VLCPSPVMERRWESVAAEIEALSGSRPARALTICFARRGPLARQSGGLCLGGIYRAMQAGKTCVGNWRVCQPGPEVHGPLPLSLD